MKKKFFVLLFLSGLVLSGLSTTYAQESKESPCPKPFISSVLPRGAATGASVKIMGSRFGKEKGSVTFSRDVNATIVSWSYQRIIITVPEKAATGPLYVTNACGAKSYPQYFTILTDR